MDYPTENQPTPLARREELVVQELPDEILVYDLRQHKAHCLNKSAAFIWEQCDGLTSVGELARLTKDEFQAPIDESMVWQTLERLGKANLLAEPVKRPSGERFRSRRAMLGKLSAAAMLSVPVVMSITSPAAAVAASLPCVTQTACTAQCQPCFPAAGNPTQCNTNTCKQTPTGFNCSSSPC